MKKTALLLMLIGVISKTFGFGREIALSYFYGASTVSDAYLISLTIPGTVFAFIGVAISTTYVPMYTKIQEESGIKEANKFTSDIINLVLLVATVVFSIVYINTEFFVKIFASGFKGETLSLAISYLKISILGIFFSGVAYILTSYLQIKNKFVSVSLRGIWFNIIIVLSIFFSSTFNDDLLPVGVVLAMATDLIILIPSAYKSGYKYKFRILTRDGNISRIAYLALPVILGTSVNQINTLVDRTLASQIVIGGISSLNYANRLNSFVEGIFITTIATVMYPSISKMAVTKNISGLKKTLSDSLVAVSLLIMPVIFGTMLFSESIVQLLFGRGAFDTTAILRTSNILFYYSIGMIGIGFREILSRVFYSLQDTKTPMINAAIGVGINIILNFILSKFLGIGGLALATSISATVTSLLMFAALRKKIGAFGIKNILIVFLKIIFASLVMSVIAKSCFNYFKLIIDRELSLLIAIGIGAISYFFVIYIMKIKEVDIVMMTIKGKIRTRE